MHWYQYYHFIILIYIRGVYVVVQFYPWFKFFSGFVLVGYDNIR